MIGLDNENAEYIVINEEVDDSSVKQFIMKTQ